MAINLDSFFTVPKGFIVCPSCDGIGTMNAPAIDAGGITAHDLHKDPEFAADYFAGKYSRVCPTCKGKRIIPRSQLQRTEKPKPTL